MSSRQKEDSASAVSTNANVNVSSGQSRRRLTGRASWCVGGSAFYPMSSGVTWTLGRIWGRSVPCDDGDGRGRGGGRLENVALKDSQKGRAPVSSRRRRRRRTKSCCYPCVDVVIVKTHSRSLSSVRRRSGTSTHGVQVPVISSSQKMPCLHACPGPHSNPPASASHRTTASKAVRPGHGGSQEIRHRPPDMRTGMIDAG